MNNCINPEKDIEQEVLSKIENESLSYAIISGKYEKEGTLHEQKSGNLQPDLDLVFFDIKRDDLHEKLLKMGMEHIQYNTYRYMGKNDSVLPIDIYIDFINAGYYYIFRIDKKSVRLLNNYNTISEKDYIVYQILEPLIKFSGYKKRHKFRINQYIKNGHVTTEIKQFLCTIIGCFLTKKILESIEKEKAISRITINMIKIKLLFKHENFSRMLKQRILKYGS